MQGNKTITVEGGEKHVVATVLCGKYKGGPKVVKRYGAFGSGHGFAKQHQF